MRTLKQFNQQFLASFPPLKHSENLSRFEFFYLNNQNLSIIEKKKSLSTMAFSSLSEP